MRLREAERLARKIVHDDGFLWRNQNATLREIDLDALVAMLTTEFKELEPAHREHWKLRPIHLSLRDLRLLCGFLHELQGRCNASPRRQASIKRVLALIVRQKKEKR